MASHRTNAFIVKFNYWNLVIDYCLVIVSCILVMCLLLAGCGNAALKKGGLYLNQNTCVGMDDLGVAKVKSGF